MGQNCSNDNSSSINCMNNNKDIKKSYSTFENRYHQLRNLKYTKTGKYSIQNDTMIDKIVLVKKIDSLGPYNNLTQLINDQRNDKVKSHEVSEDDEDTFYNELEITKKLDYPSFNRFMETSKKANNMQIVYEQQDNTQNLIEQAFNHKLSLFVIQNIAKQLAKTIRQLHTQGIVHGNICPENIVVTTIKRHVKIDKTHTETHDVIQVKLIGLGECKEFDFIYQETDEELDDIYKNSQVKCRSGNLLFTAPEVFFDKFYSKKADVYSQGIILFWLITGRYPQDPLTDEGQRQWKNGTVSNIDRLTDISKKRKNPIQLVKLVMNCIKVELEDRCDFINIVGNPDQSKYEMQFFKKSVKNSRSTGSKLNKSSTVASSTSVILQKTTDNQNSSINMEEFQTEEDLDDEKRWQKERENFLHMVADNILVWYNEWFDEMERIWAGDDRLGPLAFQLNKINQNQITQLLQIKFSNRLCRIIQIFICERYQNKMRLLEAGRIFQEIDISGKGYLNEDDIFQFMRRQSEEDEARKTMRRLFANIDINTNKSIEWSEFKLCSMELNFELVYNKLQRIYRLVNIDDNKTVNIDDIVYTLHEGSQEEIKWFKVQMTELEDNEMNIEKGHQKEMIRQIITDIRFYNTHKKD